MTPDSHGPEKSRDEANAAYVPTSWLTDGTPEQIVLSALQHIAFGKGEDDPVDVAQDALHAAGFATMKVVYNGSFELAWLKPGERVLSAGDGTGAAIIEDIDGVRRRVNVGDEVRL